MAFSLNVIHDARAASYLRNLRLQRVPSVLVKATNATADDVRDAERAAMRQVFDRPTPYTLQSLFVIRARKTAMHADVIFRQRANQETPAHYLGPQVEGGRRHKKRYERALERTGVLKPDEYTTPGHAAKLDAYGNISGGQIKRILSHLSASADRRQNISGSARSLRRRRTGGEFVVIRGEGRDGIYLRRGRKIEPWLKFVRGPTYSKRLDYYGIARATVKHVFADHVRRQWRAELGRKA